MTLPLFKHLKGTKVKHGSPGYENLEIIESITTKGVEPDYYITIQFKSGNFTHISKSNFDLFLEDGTVGYIRASGFYALEKLEIID